MGQNVTLKTIEEFIEEIDRAASDKSRTISDIKNSKVKKLICDGATAAVATGAFGIGAAALGLQSSVALGGAAIGGSAGGASVVGGAVIKSFAARGAAVTGASAGAAAGSAVPIIGTVIGGIVGVGVGILAGRASAKKQATEKQCLYQEIISKQNGTIRQLELEKNKYKSMYNKSSQDNERLKYILGVLEINNELKTALA